MTRNVNRPNRPIEEQLDYAEAVLRIALNNKTIAYLGRIKTGRCAYILQDARTKKPPTGLEPAT